MLEITIWYAGQNSVHLKSYCLWLPPFFMPWRLSFMGNEEVTEENEAASWGRVEYMILLLNGINPSGQNIIMLKNYEHHMYIYIFIFISWGYELSHIF